MQEALERGGGCWPCSRGHHGRRRRMLHANLLQAAVAAKAPGSPWACALPTKPRAPPVCAQPSAMKPRARSGARRAPRPSKPWLHYGPPGSWRANATAAPGTQHLHDTGRQAAQSPRTPAGSGSSRQVPKSRLCAAKAYIPRFWAGDGGGGLHGATSRIVRVSICLRVIGRPLHTAGRHHEPDPNAPKAHSSATWEVLGPPSMREVTDTATLFTRYAMILAGHPGGLRFHRHVADRLWRFWGHHPRAVCVRVGEHGRAVRLSPGGPAGARLHHRCWRPPSAGKRTPSRHRRWR